MGQPRIMSNSNPDVNALGVVALELAGGEQPGKAALGSEQAGELVALIGRDLTKLVPQVSELDLVFAAAHFDPAEVLRPGLPIHRRLEELQMRAPGRNHGARLLAFGADANGEIPLPLQADPALTGGALRLLPFVLAGGEAAVRRVVLQQVGVGRQVAGGVDGDDVELALQPLLVNGAQRAATDTTETVDCNLDSHGSSSSLRWMD